MKASNFLFKLTFCLILLILAVKSYSQDNYASQNSGNVNDLIKDANDRIWVGTNLGLFIHDGSNFVKIYPSLNKYKNKSISGLVSYKNYIYVKFAEGGVLRFDTQNLTSIEISNAKVNSVVQFEDDHLYLLLDNGALELYSKRKLKVLKKFKINLDTHPIMSEGPDSSLLISIPKEGLFQINAKDGGLLKNFNMMPTGYNNSFSKLMNRYFFVNYQIVFELNKSGNFETTRLLNSLENKNISFFSPIAQNKLLVVKNEKNIYYYNLGEKIHFELDKRKNYVVNRILLYDENNFYIATNQGLPKVINIEQRVTSLYDTPTQTIDFIRVRRKILPYQKNQYIFFGAPYSYIYNPTNNSFSKLSNKNTTLYDAVLINNSAFATSEGGGIYKIDLNTKKQTKVLAKDIDSVKLYMSIMDARKISAHTIVLGKRGQIILYNFVSNKSEVKSLGVNARVRSLLLDTIYKNIYIATDSGVYLFDYLAKKISNKIFLKGIEVSDIKISHYLNKSILWCGSANGILGFDIKSGNLIKQVSIENFNNSKIANILLDKYNNVWISTFTGIFAYNYSKNILLKLNSDKQLVNNEFNYKSAAVLQDGQLIFGGLNGYDIINPINFQFTSSPNNGEISFYELVDNKNRELGLFKSKSIIYNKAFDYLKIYFTTKKNEYLTFYSFEYQLDNSNWLSLKNEKSVTLYKLSDGLHELKIRGFDELGRPINFETIKINYLVPFYEKDIFLILLLSFIIILLIFSGWIFYKKVNDEKILKDQISMDLHDEVGTLLTKAIFILKEDEIKNGNKNKALLSYISEGLFNLRTYINTFKIKNIKSDELLDEIKEFKKNFLQNTNIESVFEVQFDKTYLISASQYRNLKLISYEIHNNIVKHSKATKMHSSINVSGGVLYIETEDNGIFNDMSILNNNGNGINNLKKRVKQLGGQISFSIAASGNGLNIKTSIKF